MTHVEDVVRTEIDRRVERCGITPSPIDQVLQLARRADRTQRRRRRAAALASLSAAFTLAVGNLAVASATPGTIPATAPNQDAVSGSFVSVAAVHPPGAAKAMTLWLGADPSGRSDGCVSLTPEGDRPPAQLPNIPASANSRGTVCSFREGGVKDQIGYVTAGPAAPGGPVVAYGFVPSSAVKVTLTMRNRGFFLFRLLKPTEQVEAELYGSSLRLPVKAWQGPDLSGYSVKKIEARDTDKVVATLSFG